MELPGQANLTCVLDAAAQGDPRAAEQLLPILYDELHRLAHSYMNRQAEGNTLQTTALVHEAYMRLVGNEDPGWNGRGHFFAAAAQAMRQILIEQARRKAAVKHGGEARRVDIAAVEPEITPPSDDVLALNEALAELEQTEPRMARLVLLRHFAGLTMPEAAAAMGISLSTAEREWRFARALLFTRIREKNDES
jgi:RNA polymerase sigma factor (TIGR02999 family)